MLPDSFKAEILGADAASGNIDLGRPVWVYGTGGFGTAVARALQAKGATVSGFVETRPGKESWLSLPVRAAGEVKFGPDDQLVVGIFNREAPYLDIAGVLRETGIGSVHWPVDYYGQLADLLGSRYWLSSASVFRDDIESIGAAYALLDDETSRETFQRIIRFRMGQDLDYSQVRHEEEQYFSHLTLPYLPKESLRYVDGGAYDGDSFRALCSHIEPTEAYLFEPDPDNYARLVTKVTGGSANVRCLPLALSDGYRILSWSDDGEGSAISENGTNRVATAKLDDLFTNTTIDLLKLDIEGGEIDALKGAERIIREGRPVICLSLYHKPDDLWRIPLLLASMVDDYAFHIRQHMFNSFDSVLYAVPKSR